MRKFLALALFLFLVQGVALAAGPVKISVLNMGEILRNSEPGAEAIKQIDAKLRPERERIEKQKNEFIKMQEDFQKQAFALAPDARQDKERELRRKEFELNEAARMYQNAANREQESKLSDIQRILVEVIRDYCSKNAVTFLMPKEALIYAEPSTDVTGQVTQELNRAWKNRKK